MKSALLKSALWILAEVAYHISITPPQKRYSKDNVPKNGNLMNTIHRYTVPSLKALSLVVTLFEILTIHSPYFRRISSYPSSCDAATVDPRFLASCLSLFIFFGLRVCCYRTLGSLFTFETTIRPNHTLVTSGPYNFVRHPSYIALYGVWLGQLLMHVYTCDSWPALIVFAITMPEALVVALLLGSRTKEEDEVLHKRFGAEWVSYSMRVPHRFVPWVI